MSYSRGSHTVYHHRYHIVWITKYRYKVLEGALRQRIRVIIRQVCDELGVQIVSGVLSKEHVHMFVEIPPHIAVSDFVRRVNWRSSHRQGHSVLHPRTASIAASRSSAKCSNPSTTLYPRRRMTVSAVLRHAASTSGA